MLDPAANPDPAAGQTLQIETRRRESALVSFQDRNRNVTWPPPPVLLKRALPLAVVAVAQLAILIGAGVSGNEKPLTPAQKRVERADVGGPFPLELRSPQVVAGTSARVLVALRRPSLAELNAQTPQSPLRQRAYVRSLHHEERALMSAFDPD